MSLIDWSDPEAMIGLLMEYVADEALAEICDAARAAFLRSLSTELEELAGSDILRVDQIADAIRDIRDSQAEEFVDDAVMPHLDACVEEPRRIGSRTGCESPPQRVRLL